MQFSGKFGVFTPPLEGSRPPLGKILDPPLISIHVGNDSKELICSICGRRRVDENHEKDHDKMSYKCPKADCGWMYQNLPALRTHCYRSHGKSVFKNLSVQPAAGLDLLGQNAMKTERSSEEDYTNRDQIVLGEVRCDAGTNRLEGIRIKTEPPDETEGGNMQVGKQNDSNVHTDVRNQDDAPHIKAEVSFSDTGGIDETTFIAGNNLQGHSFQQHRRRLGVRSSIKTGVHQCQLCGRRLKELRTYQYHIENHEKMQYKCVWLDVRRAKLFPQPCSKRSQY